MQIKNTKKFLSLFFVAFILGVVFLLINFYSFRDSKRKESNRVVEMKPESWQKEGEQSELASREEKKSENKTEESFLEKKEVERELPKSVLISVPFTTQAPFSKWDEIHEETCEEASLLMVKYYLDGKKLTSQIAEEELQKLVKFQNKNRGDYKDTTAQETAELGHDFFGIQNFRVVYNFSAADLKKQLSLGKPIIVPAAGRKLGNPNFTPPGPLYHNLVLVGYEGDVIITNDPGTRKGEGYRYNLGVLYEAIHDFPGRPEDIEKGRKAMIILD